MTGQIPDQVDAIAERGDGAAIQHTVINRAQNRDGFTSPGILEIESIQRNLMGIAIGQIHVESESGARATGGIVSGGNTAAGGSVRIQRTRVGGGRNPCVLWSRGGD